MRRPVLVLALALLTAATMTSPAVATGPGGWTHLGVGSPPTTASLNGAVTALNTSNPGVLYAGGSFTSAGGHSLAKRIAAWNGSAWSSIGNTPLTNGSVFAIAYHAGKLFVGGTFVNAGGDANADYLAEYNGSAWVPFCTSTVSGPAFTASVAALQIVGNTLYVGGSFQNGAGIPSADFLVGCDLTSGVATSTVAGDGDINSGVKALTADSNGVLYAGGAFINMAGIPEADHVAAFDGSWHAMGGGPFVDSIVRSLASQGTSVYVGTDAVNVAGIAKADHVVRWNGAAWSALGTSSAGTDGWFPTNAFIYALATYGTLVLAAGSFQNANGNAAADNIAYFDGATWRALGSNGAGNGPLLGNGTAVAVTGGMVDVGGSFTSVGGDGLAKYIAGHALRLPDALISGSSATGFAGNNAYSPTAAGEVRSVSVAAGQSTTAYLRIQNDGIVPAAFFIHGTGTATGYSARWYTTSEISSAVRGGTYATPTIAPGAIFTIRLVVSLSSAPAAQATFLTTARASGLVVADAVRLSIKTI